MAASDELAAFLLGGLTMQYDYYGRPPSPPENLRDMRIREAKYDIQRALDALKQAKDRLRYWQTLEDRT